MENKIYNYERKNKDECIIKYIESKKINLEEANKDLGAKVDFLVNHMGWKSLRVARYSDYNKYCPISLCSDERINAVTKKTYEEAKRRLSSNAIQLEFEY